MGVSSADIRVRQATEQDCERLYRWRIAPEWVVFIPGLVPGLHHADELYRYHSQAGITDALDGNRLAVRVTPFVRLAGLRCSVSLDSPFHKTTPRTISTAVSIVLPS
jgi:hypothetical protein